MRSVEQFLSSTGPASISPQSESTNWSHFMNGVENSTVLRSTDNPSLNIPWISQPTNWTSTVLTTFLSSEDTISSAFPIVAPWWGNFTRSSAINWAPTRCYDWDDQGTMIRVTTGVFNPLDHQCYASTVANYQDCKYAAMLAYQNSMSLLSLMFTASSSGRITVTTFPAITWTSTPKITSTFEIGTQKYGVITDAGPAITFTDKPITSADMSMIYSQMTSLLGGTATCATNCGQCIIQNVNEQFYSGVRLLYWPKSDAADQQIANPSISPPQTIVLHDTTLVSPYVYISFSSLSALNHCGLVGKAHTDVLLTLSNPELLSSISWYLGTQIVTFPVLPNSESIFSNAPSLLHCSTSVTISASDAATCWLEITGTRQFKETKSFDYRDLNWPYPPGVYSGQPGCVVAAQWGRPDYCDLITQPYKPILAVPKEVSLIDPLWNTCKVLELGVEDPPFALQPVAAPVMASTITPELPTAVAASPGPAIPIPLPAQTPDPPLGSWVPTPPAKPVRPGPTDSNGDSGSVGGPGSVGDPGSVGGPGSAGGTNSDGVHGGAPNGEFPFPPLHVSFNGKTFTAIAKGVLGDGSTIIRAGDDLAMTAQGQILTIRTDGKVWLGSPTHLTYVGDTGDPKDPDWKYPPSTWVLPNQVINIKGLTIRRISSSALLVDGQLLRPGDSAVISGNLVKIAASGKSMMIGAEVVGIPILEGTTTLADEWPYELLPNKKPGMITLGNHTLTPNAQGAYVVGDQTISLPVVAGKEASEGIPTDDSRDLMPIVSSKTAMLTLGSKTYTAGTDGVFTIDGQKIVPGGEITIAGTIISLASNDAFAIVGSSTELLLPSITTGIGGLIVSGPTRTNVADLYFILSE